MNFNSRAAATSGGLSLVDALLQVVGIPGRGRSCWPAADVPEYLHRGHHVPLLEMDPLGVAQDGEVAVLSAGGNGRRPAHAPKAFNDP